MQAVTDRFHLPGVAARLRYTLGLDSPRSKVVWDKAFGIAKTLGRKLVNVEPWADEDVSNCYVGGKRKIYERAFRHMPSYYSPRWEKVKAFVKIEKYTYYSKIDRIPRPIQPRSMYYRAYLSKFMKPIEKKMKSLVMPGCVLPFMAKGLSSLKLAERFCAMWGRFTSPVALSLDLSKFDGTIHPELKKLENTFYRFMSKDRRFLCCLNAQEKDEYYIMKKTFKHGRCSGDPQTGCGNTLLMAIVCRVIFDWRIEIFANGDDTIVIFERNMLELARERLADFALFGLDVREESCTTDLYDVNWCQSNLTKTAKGHMWIRDYRRVLLTILSNVEYEPIKARSLMLQIAEAEAHQNPGQPIISPVCEWILNNFSGGRRYRFQHHQDSLERRELIRGGEIIAKPSPQDRYEFCRRFLITPDEQVAIENRIIGRLRSFVAGEVLVTEWEGRGVARHPYGVRC
jgi:hypothetical protein